MRLSSAVINPVRFIQSKLPFAISLVQRLSGTAPLSGRRPLTESEYSKIWDGPAHSISDYLPWVDYDDEAGVFELNDGVSVGMVFELRQVNVEGKSSEFIGKVQKALMRAVGSIPEVLEGNPWIIQVYLQDEPIELLVSDMQNYVKESVRETKYSKEWFQLLDQHVRQMSREHGLFEDEAAGIRWRGLNRRARVVIYRHTNRSDWLTESNKLKRPGKTPASELKQTARVFLRNIQISGVIVNKIDGKAFYEWMGPFFSPKPMNAADGYEWVRSIKKYPPQGKRSPFYDYGQSVFSDEPRSDDEGRFWFCNMPTKFLSITPLEGIPPTGITAELKNASGKEVSLWDELPRGSMFVMSIVVESQLQIKGHLNGIVSAGGLSTRESTRATDQAESALEYMAEGNRIYRVFPGIYIRAEDEATLDDSVLNAMTLLSSAGLSVMPPQYDLSPIDSFLRSLPMAYSYKYDRSRSKRAWLCSSHDIASLLPLYGRATGTGHPGFFFFSRQQRITCCSI